MNITNGIKNSIGNIGQTKFTKKVHEFFFLCTWWKIVYCITFFWVFEQLGSGVPSGRVWNWRVPGNNACFALRGLDWQRADGAGNLTSSFTSRLCKQKEHRIGFLIVFTSMHTSKNVLRVIFSFYVVGILLSRKANKIIEEAYVYVLVKTLI